MVEKIDEGRSRGPEQRLPEQKERRERTDLGKVGRRAAAVVYALLTLWICIAALRSVVPQIFWPAADAQHTEADCRSALSELRASLVRAAAESVGETAAPTAFPAALADFDARHQALRTACGASPGYGELLSFRYALATQIGRYTVEVLPLSERARASLDP